MTQDERLAQVTAVQAQYSDELMQKPNVVGVAVGLVQRGGASTGEVGLVVLVSRKIPDDLLDEADRIPSELDGIRVDVQEVGEITAF
ncbi:MAG: hypothetical protein H6672_17375 [Anaerolineaceae bacterium]|nr:hypothetical protein [Anaerolineaceae bacterium]